MTYRISRRCGRLRRLRRDQIFRTQRRRFIRATISKLPEMMFMIASERSWFLIIVFAPMRVIALADTSKRKAPDDGYARCVQQTDRDSFWIRLAAPSRLQPIRGSPGAATLATVEFRAILDDFEQMVSARKGIHRRRRYFQVVLSQRFESAFSGDPLDLYRCLTFR